jgi:hypothetical protein
MLVAAVLGPEQREDRELEMVRLAPEQVDDPGELAVREPERPVDREVLRGGILQRLFGDPGQRASVAGPSDGTRRRKGTSAAGVEIEE